MTLADLKGVNLRRASLGSGNALAAVAARRKSFHGGQVMNDSTTPEMFKVRSSLRRIHANNQSPSRDARRNSLDCGEGPTPMLTRALRRKFQAACPLSPIHSLSPTNSSTADSPISHPPPSPPPPSAQTTAPPSPPPNSAQTTNASSPLSVLEIREV